MVRCVLSLAADGSSRSGSGDEERSSDRSHERSQSIDRINHNGQQRWRPSASGVGQASCLPYPQCYARNWSSTPSTAIELHNGLYTKVSMKIPRSNGLVSSLSTMSLLRKGTRTTVVCCSHKVHPTATDYHLPTTRALMPLRSGLRPKTIVVYNADSWVRRSVSTKKC
jgi:hypothetical protein